MEIVSKYTDEWIVLCENVSIRGQVWMSSVVQCEWMHLGLGSALECGREMLLD